MNKRLLALAILAAGALAVASPSAEAGNTTLWNPNQGAVVLPISPPTNNGATPGALDNTAIGQTTPAPGAFTSLSTTTGVSGPVNATTFTSTDGVACPSILPAAATDAVFFVANRAYDVVSASAVFSAAAGGASKLQLVKDTGTDAPGAGTDLLTNNTNTGFDLNGTPNTVQAGTLVAKALAAGDRLSVDFANAIQSSAGIVVTVCLAPR